MHVEEKQYPDMALVISVFLLIFIGIIMVYSASGYYAERVYNDSQFFLKKHVMWLFLGLLGMGIAYRIPYKKLQRLSPFLLLVSLIILVDLAFFHKGRWMYLGPVHFQGVDVARFALIFFLADSLSRKENILQSYSEGLFPHLFYIGLFGFLVVRQPDFSSAFLLVLTGLTLLFVAPIKMRHLTATAFAFLPLALLVIAVSPYKVDRIKAFLEPEKDLAGKGYQIYQSLISLGSGGISGVGFAQSKQKLFFLPEAHTDFIFSIVGEEWGLVGTLLIVSLFGVIMFRGIKIARHASDRFTFYLTVGLTSHFVYFALAHMMVTLHLLPPTGLPLPFVSYGGTSLFFSCVAAGLLLKISSETFSPAALKQKEFSSYALKNLSQRKHRVYR